MFGGSGETVNGQTLPPEGHQIAGSGCQALIYPVRAVVFRARDASEKPSNQV
jgi:hypothetical protein